MDIKYTNIGTDFEKFELYLKLEDYHKLFKEEIAFGKLLHIFSDLGKIISDDPENLKAWVLNNPIYKDVIEVSQKIYEILETNETKK